MLDAPEALAYAEWQAGDEAAFNPRCAVMPALAGGFGLLWVERILQALWSGHEATQRGGNPSLSQ
jgi:hypothetical protein